MANGAPTACLGDLVANESNVPDSAIFLRAGATTTYSASSEGENLPDNSFATGDGTQFKVRKGPNYSKTGAKELSLDCMYDLIGVDNFRTEKRLYPFSPIATLPPLAPHAQKWSHPHVPATIVLNIQLPDVPAKMFGNDADAASLHIVGYYQIREDTIAALTTGEGHVPAHKLFADWCEQAFTDEKMRGRLKMIGVVGNYRKLGLPTLLEGYNGKPAIIFKTGSLVRGKDNAFLEIGVSVHLFPFLTRKSIHSLKDKARSMLIHLAGVIEARSDDEMPERIAFCGHLIKPLAFDAPLLSQATVDWLTKQAEARGHNQIVDKKGSDFKD